MTEVQPGAFAVVHVGVLHEARDGLRGGIGEEPQQLRRVVGELVVHPHDLALLDDDRDAFAESVEGGGDARITGGELSGDEIAGGAEEVGDDVRHPSEEGLGRRYPAGRTSRARDLASASFIGRVLLGTTGWDRESVSRKTA